MGAGGGVCGSAACVPEGSVASAGSVAGVPEGSVAECVPEGSVAECVPEGSVAGRGSGKFWYKW